MIFILFAILLSGCGMDFSQKIEVNGKVLTCKNVSCYSGGCDAFSCDDGNDYRGLVNVKFIGG